MLSWAMVQRRITLHSSEWRFLWYCGAELAAGFYILSLT